MKWITNRYTIAVRIRERKIEVASVICEIIIDELYRLFEMIELF